MIHEKIIRRFKRIAEVALRDGYYVKLNNEKNSDLLDNSSRSILILQFFKDIDYKRLDWMITVEDNPLQEDYYKVGLEQKQYLGPTDNLGVKYRRVRFEDVPDACEHVIKDELAAVVSGLNDWRKNRKVLEDIPNTNESIKPNLFTEEYLYFKGSCEDLIGVETMSDLDTISAGIHIGSYYKYENLYYNPEGAVWRA